MQHHDITDTRSTTARRGYTAGRLVRFGEAIQLTLGGSGCQADCWSKSRPATLLH